MKTFANGSLLSWLKAPLKSAIGNRLSLIGIGFVVALSIVVVIEQVRTALHERTRAIADTNLDLRNLAKAVAAHADNALRLADMTAGSIALQLETDGAERPSLLRLQKLARGALADLPMLTNAVVIDETGSSIMAVTPSSTIKSQFTERDYFSFHRSNPSRIARVGHPIRAYSSGNWVIPVTRRIDHADGSFAGVVAVTIELAYFETFYRSLEVHEGGTIGLYFDDRSPLGSNRTANGQPRAIDAALDGNRLSTTAAGNTLTLTADGGPDRQNGHVHLKRYPLAAITSSPMATALALWRESILHRTWSSILRLVLLGLLGAILVFQMRSRRRAEAILEEKAMQFRLVVDRIEDYGIYTLNTIGVVTSWNAGAERLTGLNAEEVVGRHYKERFASDLITSEQLTDSLNGALHTGRHETERWRVRKDGTRCLINLITTPLFDTAGTHYGFLKVGRDVTASRQSEAMLEASEFRWKFALEGAGEGVWDWNEQTGVINFSRPYMTMLGYEENEIEGSFEGWRPLVHPDDIKGVYQAYTAHQEGRSPNYMQEYRIRCKDGTYKWVLARGMVVSRDTLGKALRTIGTQADISQLKAAQQGLNQQNALVMKTNAQLQQANQVKSEFLANMSHELRTPLNAVLGFTGTLLMELPGPLNPEQRKQLEAVRAGGRHLLDLINEILDLSKIESGMTEISCRDFNIQELIAEVVHSLLPLATEKTISLALDLPSGDISVFSDLRLVKQILINLIGNAIKFTESGGVTVRLANAAAPNDSIIIVDVIDTGIGIDETDLGKLFQPFTQLESGLTRRFEGTGLGLNLSKKYADLLGARLLVRSKRGEGTTFSLQLPRVPVPMAMLAAA